MKTKTPSLTTRLAGSAAMGLALSAMPASPQQAGNATCALVDGVLPEGCDFANEATVVRTPVGANTEVETGAVPGVSTGFSIAIDGETLVGDARVEDAARRADVALADADVQVRFDGLEINPRLDVEIAGDPQAYGPGDSAEFISRTNYPAFIERAEMRVIDMRARGGPRTVAVAPVAANGRVSLTLPEGEDLAVVHRVYDKAGRFDETVPLPLSVADDRGFREGFEEGSDNLARQRIPLSGGSITVFGSNVAQAETVEVLGEDVRPGPDGKFVIQRIRPAGTYDVEVGIRGAGRNVDFARTVTIPGSEWFYVATADLTFGQREQSGEGDAAIESSESYAQGRLAFYAKGKTKNGVIITASADTGNEDLEDIFRNLDEKDPRSLLDRFDPDLYYPTYGDDSTVVENAPTSGKFFLRVEKEQNYFQWGNGQASLAGNYFLRNERTVYGAEGRIATAAQTSGGEPRAELTFYAAQPDNLPQREIFQGTGGSVYFLQRQDISVGSETVSIQVRDEVSGRVIETQVLVYGRDYAVNYVQGVITLAAPLSATITGGLVSSAPGEGETVNLVVNYEFTPTTGDLDGFSYGARAQAWVTDQLRVGVTGTTEETGIAEQTSIGADILYRYSEGTEVSLDYAKTEGPGFGFSTSVDGGLIVDNIDPAEGDGEAYRLAARVDFKDLGFESEGYFGAYYEHRTEGFSTLDYQVLAGTGDETLWGIYGEGRPNERLRWAVYYDDYENAVGDYSRTGGAELEYAINPRLGFAVGIEHTDKNNSTDVGRRTDAALRLTFAPNDRAEYYVFGQTTLDREGLDRNDRYGIGGAVELGRGWTIAGEISEGTSGTGGKLRAEYTKDDATSYYFGYELDPGREYGSYTLVGEDRGRFVLGGTRKVSDQVRMFGENSYDIFGGHRSLTSAYGLEYTPSDYVAYTFAYEVGLIRDSINGDFDRNALSFGVRYEDDKLTARGRIEARKERGVISSIGRDADTFLITADARYKISEEARLVFSLDASKTETDQSSVLDGELIDLTLGYAYRPVLDDRLNVLVRYRFLYDDYGQQIDGSDTAGPVQTSHVFSLDAEYDLSKTWTIGGKLGARLSESAPSSEIEKQQNDAYLAVASARYHLVHNWDILLEARALHAVQAELTQYGALAAVYRHVGNNVKLGVGYNFTSFSDDLTDLVQDDKGLFLNVIAKF
ncbi:hypothetical protein IV417_15045 [Alphaproteobacteria bacterium KMM 3653]|uniref:Outer membrane protein beta-barrel domain-containing protein n=1 Tax=Harenicola maris TaxID=2841044 RepID=A0AAP2CQY8_9RHOB|nr:hypothetical protein [Harenicola maris]